MGHSQILLQPRGWALAYPRATPGHLTYVISKDGWFIGKDEAFVKDLLVRQGLKKPVDVFKGLVCFLSFRHFLISCKHINISDKVNYILFTYNVRIQETMHRIIKLFGL